MKIFGYEINKYNQKSEKRYFNNLSLLFGGGTIPNDAMKLSSVYRCVDIISDSISQLPIDVYFIDDAGKKSIHSNHQSYLTLQEPNKISSRYTLMKLMVSSMLLNGNGYAIIKRDENNNVIGLNYIDPNKVIIKTIEDEFGCIDKVYYTINGKTLESDDILHFINYTSDGITGISTISNAVNSISLSNSSELHAKSFFKNGGNISGIISVDSELDDTQRADIKSTWNNTFNGNESGVAVMQYGMKYQPITINPVDAQLLETRKYNVIDICRFFGVSPVKLFDLSHSGYATVEAQQLGFLTDTLSPLISKIELEIKRKLFKPSERGNISVKFDTEEMISVDKSSLASYYSQLFNMGVLNINEIRSYLDLPAIKNGDNYFVQQNAKTLLQAIKQGENEE